MWFEDTAVCVCVCSVLHMYSTCMREMEKERVCVCVLLYSPYVNALTIYYRPPLHKMLVCAFMEKGAHRSHGLQRQEAIQRLCLAAGRLGSEVSE